MALDAERDANASYIASLDQVRRDAAAQVTADLAVEADVLRAEVALLDARQLARALDRPPRGADRAPRCGDGAVGPS